MRAHFCLILWILAGVSAAPLMAQPFSFEGYVDSTLLTTQYTGVTFSNTIILTTGITLDEFEFPAHSGSNVASDNGGPITIAFPSAMRGFGGYFTAGVPLMLEAFDSSNTLLATTSYGQDNEGLSGTAGTQPNHLLTVTSNKGVYKVVITGGSLGNSFTVDDAFAITRCDLDLDGRVDASDAQAIINEALGGNLPADDLNSDGIVNVVDIQIVVNAALSKGCSAR